MTADGKARSGAHVRLAGIALAAAVAGFAAVYVTFAGPGKVQGPPSADPTIAGGPTGSRVATPDNAAASLAGPDSRRSLSSGSMTAFVFRKNPEPLPEIAFSDGSGKPMTLANFKGRIVLLNLWATWCAPCRKEMPALDALQKQLGSETFEVVALSVDRQGADAARKFLREINVESLKLYVDPSARAATTLKAVGMPTTILIGKDGREIGRLVGPAEWDSKEAKSLISASIE